MSYSPLVSIILPVYNGEKTLRATMDSLMAQTFTDFELVIGIDGTTDGSKAIVESYKDSRIRLIEHPKNLGLANNVNTLIEQLHPDSEFIAMAEQDDVYVLERLEWQVAVMQEHPKVGLVSGIAEFIGDGGNILFPGILVQGNHFPQGEALFKYLYINQLKVVNTCMLWRKEVHHSHALKFHNTYGNFCVDWDYISRFALLSEIYGIPKVLVQMNRQKGNQSVTTNKDAQHKASRQLLKDFKEEFPEVILNQDYNAALKTHRKIELGHRSKGAIIFYGIYYSILYQDAYFLRYIISRVKSFLIK